MRSGEPCASSVCLSRWIQGDWVERPDLANEDGEGGGGLGEGARVSRHTGKRWVASVLLLGLRSTCLVLKWAYPDLDEKLVLALAQQIPL